MEAAAEAVAAPRIVAAPRDAEALAGPPVALRCTQVPDSGVQCCIRRTPEIRL